MTSHPFPSAPGSDATASAARRWRVSLAIVPLVVGVAACESDDETPSESPVVPGSVVGSTTSSLPGPEATAAPNPAAGGGATPTSAP